MSLKINDVLLWDLILFFRKKELYHSCDWRSYRLFHFGCNNTASSNQKTQRITGEFFMLWTKESIKYVSCQKVGFNSVDFYFANVKDSPDCDFSFILTKQVIWWWLIGEIVANDSILLLLSELPVDFLRIFRHSLFRFSLRETQHILLIHSWQVFHVLFHVTLLHYLLERKFVKAISS